MMLSSQHLPLLIVVMCCVYRATFRAVLILLPLLGITWALGFLVVLNNAVGVVVEWLFFSFNTLQVSHVHQTAHIIMLPMYVLISIGCHLPSALLPIHQRCMLFENHNKVLPCTYSTVQLRLAFMKKFGCRQVANDIERDIPWTRRPSMQISSALQSARRSSIIESFLDSSRRSSFGDSSRRSSWRGSGSSNSKNDDSFYNVS